MYIFSCWWISRLIPSPPIKHSTVVNISVQVSSSTYSTVTLEHIARNGRLVVWYLHFNFTTYCKGLFEVVIPVKVSTALYPGQLMVCQPFYFQQFDVWCVIYYSKQTNKKEQENYFHWKRNNPGFGGRQLRFECWPWELCDLDKGRPLPASTVLALSSRMAERKQHKHRAHPPFSGDLFTMPLAHFKQGYKWAIKDAKRQTVRRQKRRRNRPVTQIGRSVLEE